MKFYICIKQVPDINAPIQIKNGDLIRDTDRTVLNAYDASAVEEALVLAEKHGGEVEVEAVLVGPDNASETIRKALAMGADKATHIRTGANIDYDSSVYAKILARFFQDKEYDIILCGKQSQDTDAGLTGSMLAAHLDLPYATNAVGLQMEGDQLIVTRQGDSGREIIALPGPCLVTCSNDMNEPRIPSLKGIMQSKRKPVETVGLEDLEIDEAALQTKTNVTAYREKPEREAGQKFEGDPEELAQRVARLLDEEANAL